MLKKLPNNFQKITTRNKPFKSKKPLSQLLPAIVAHGGISTDFTRYAPMKTKSLLEAVNHGFKVLSETDNSLDAVEAAMVYMEDSLDFNTGYGSMLNEAGEVEMDCSLMFGEDLSTGAVGCISDVKNPVKVARAVMGSKHVLFCCEGAKEFAKKHNFEILKPGALVTERSKKILKDKISGPIGNAGVVAIDKKGHMAACTGSGGIVGRHPGRISECARIGCGIYADDNIGVISVSGDGECILRCLLAYSVIKRIESGLSARDSIYDRIRFFHTVFGKPAGAIGFDKSAELAIHFTSPLMPWAYRSPSEIIHGSTIKELPVKYRNYLTN